MKSSWRHCLLRSGAGAVVLAVGIGNAIAQVHGGQLLQPYPSRPIRILTGNQPGIVSDILARLVAERLEALWATPVVVENRPGAGGTMAAESVAKSPPDGYTLLLGSHSNLVLARAVRRELRYDPQRDLAPIGQIAEVPFALAAHKRVPVGSVSELIAYATTRPGQLTYATEGPGTMSQLSVEMLTAATGIAIALRALQRHELGDDRRRRRPNRRHTHELCQLGTAPEIRRVALARCRRRAAADCGAKRTDNRRARRSRLCCQRVVRALGARLERHPVIDKLTSALSQIRRMPDVRHVSNSSTASRLKIRPRSSER